MGDHDSEVMDIGRVDRDDTGTMGVLIAGGEGVDGAAVRGRSGGVVGEPVPGRIAE